MPESSHNFAEPNKLIHEKSPYLLQHAHNAVRWMPWSDEAFQIARDQNKPVFVSIGYATCHWCHVMEHESFTDPEIAAYLAENMIAIKVDREERPDIDAMCMEVCQAMTGHGGWPLTVFMDHQKRPFFAGTYYPRYSQSNRLGFLDLLQRITHAWNNEYDHVRSTCIDINQQLTLSNAASTAAFVPNTIFDTVAQVHTRTFDAQYGGFNGAPKFPSAHHLLILLRTAWRTKNPELTRMVASTINNIRAGGIYDQIGLGVHRYSTDKQWFLPHFEKMLYDQAMLMMAATELWQQTGMPLYKTIVEELAEYVQRDLTSPEGAFYCAEDADSEGEEGRFYTWENIPTTQHFKFAEVHDEATGTATGRFHTFIDPEDIANTLVNEEAQRVRKELLLERGSKIRPLLDDKILTDWNGLMIVALARASRALNSATLLQQATNAFAAVQQLCATPELHHRYRDGETAIPAFADDYAALGLAAVELYQCTGGIHYLHTALQFADILRDQFVGVDGAIVQTTIKNTDGLPQQKEGFDNAYPCGNSMAALLFTALSVLGEGSQYRTAAETCVQTWGSRITQYPNGFCMLLTAYDTLVNGELHITFVGNCQKGWLAKAKELLYSSYLPHAVYSYTTDTRQQSKFRVTQIPTPITPHEEQIIICTATECLPPFTTLTALEQYLWHIS